MNYKEMIQVRMLDGNILTFDIRNEDRARAVIIADLTAHVKRDYPEKSKHMQIAQCVDVYFMIDETFKEILSPPISLDYVQT